MATPDFLKWLEREEEVFGMTGTIERTIDPDMCRSMLLEELGYDPSDAQVNAMYEAGRMKYETLPEIGAGTSSVTYPWGKQTWYRDLTTGRRIGLADVESRMEVMGMPLPPPFKLK